MRCLIWAAVSSKPQSEEAGKDSIPAQIAAAREVIERNEGWHEVAEPVIIPGHSRNYIFLSDSVSDIPQYAQLINHARERSIDLLICRGRDRLGRTDALIAQVEEYLASYNVQILSLSMPTRVQDPEEFARRKDRASIWMRSVERAKAQDEIAELTARHDMGMRRRVKDGLNPGRLPMGYRLDPETNVAAIHETEAETVRLIFRWFLEGRSAFEIVKRLPSHAVGRYPKTTQGVRYILENPFYAGLVAWNRRRKNRWMPRKEWLIAEGQHDAIIDVDMWEDTQVEISRRRTMGRRAPYTENPLSGLVFCSYCGGSMKVDRGKSQPRRYYICGGDDCQRNSIRLDRLEEIVAAWIRECAHHPDMLQDALQSLVAGGKRNSVKDDLKRLQRSLERKRDALARWTADYEDGLLGRSDYYGHKLRLDEETEAIEGEIEEQESRIVDPETVMGHYRDLLHITGADLTSLREDPQRLPEIKASLRAMGLRITIKDKAADLCLSL